MSISKFKFFKGQLKLPVFVTEDRVRLPLDERWMWISSPTIVIANYDNVTGEIIQTRHNVIDIYCTFSEFIFDIVDNSKSFYIYDIMSNNGEMIPPGTTLTQMGLYDWSDMFRIRAIVLYE